MLPAVRVEQVPVEERAPRVAVGDAEEAERADQHVDVEGVDVVAEVADFLRDRVKLAVRYGIPVERIIVDPGFDLNKNTHHSLELIRRLDEIAAIGLPLLVAVSNKDFIGETLDREQGRRLEGTLAAAVACILQGARIVRMHEVAAAVAAVRLTEAILGFRQPAFVRHNARQAYAA